MRQKIQGIEYSIKTKDPKQASIPFDRYNVKDEGTDKNLLMEYIEESPKGSLDIPSKYNPVGDRCDA